MRIEGLEFRVQGSGFCGIQGSGKFEVQDFARLWVLGVVSTIVTRFPNGDGYFRHKP